MMENFKTSSTLIENAIITKFERYAKYIILDRALPDLRDGLKPVQRRILFALYKMDLTSDKHYRKCAKIVGEIIGKYHPHGDSSVYSAMVRLSQDWKLNIPLLIFQGNNGSIDSDPPAAMRYTEAKLSKISNFMVEDLKYDNIVKYTSNFDDTEQEPTFLPAFFPNLLINGAVGIATGYATEIPCHNPKEIFDCLKYYLNHNKINSKKIVSFLKGPEFPTYGNITFIDEWETIVKNGSGRIYIQCDYDIENISNTKNKLIIKSIPYNVVKSSLVKQIDSIFLDKKFPGIYNVIDESDRTGIRIAIDYDKKIDKNVLVDYLSKNTQFRISYSCNYTMIDNHSPSTCSIEKIIKSTSNFHMKLIKNKYEIILDIKNKRLEIINGLIIITKNIKESVSIIMNSSGTTEAINNLIKRFKLTHNQAKNIINLRLYRLTSNNIDSLLKEKHEIDIEIKNINGLLNNVGMLKTKLFEIYDDILKIIPNERKSNILGDYVKQDFSLKNYQEKLVSNISKEVIFTTSGYYVKQNTISSFDTKIKENKFIDKIPIFFGKVKEKGFTILLTKKGKGIFLKNYILQNSNFEHLNKVFNLDLYNNEIIWAKSFNTSEKLDNNRLIIVTELGKIKVIKLHFTNIPENKYTNLISISPKDYIIGAKYALYSSNILFITKRGYVLAYPLKMITETYFRSGTVKSFNIKKDDRVVSFKIFSDNKPITLLNNKFMSKIIDPNNYLSLNKNIAGKNVLPHKSNLFLIPHVIDDEKLVYLKINNKIYSYTNKNYNSVIGMFKNKLTSLNSTDIIYYYIVNFN